MTYFPLRTSRTPRCHLPSRRPSRRGLTLIELVLAMGIMALLMGALGTMASAVYQGTEYSRGYGLATQHARVVMQRINRLVNTARANEQFPGVIVVPSEVSGWRFPDTLVIWSPDGTPAALDGLPRVGELVLLSPNPVTPSELLEITLRGSTSVVPEVANTAAWQSLVANLQTSDTARRVVLTGLLRTAAVPEGGSGAEEVLKACVRFETRLSPSQSEWDELIAGTRDWDALDWPQSMYSVSSGVRQTWLRYELQLLPGLSADANPDAVMQAVPFLGSSALYYSLERP